MFTERMKKALASLRTQRRSDLISVAGMTGFGIGFLLAMLSIPLNVILDRGSALGTGIFVSGFAFGIASIVFMFAAHTLQLNREPRLVRALGTPGRDAAAFRELMQMDTAAVPLLLEALATPSGTMSVNNAVTWDGERAHRHAVEGLGHLKAREAVEPLCQLLASWDHALTEKTIWALGEIGDLRAVAALIPWLGDAKHKTFAEFALERLGERELVQAFQEVLRGDRTTVARMRKAMRPEVGDALIRALDNDEFALNATYAIDELGIAQALPKLRSLLRGTSNAAILMALRRTIANLEAHAGLPRPAEAAPVEVATLPRPTLETDPHSETLPRQLGSTQ